MSEYVRPLVTASEMRLTPPLDPNRVTHYVMGMEMEDLAQLGREVAQIHATFQQERRAAVPTQQEVFNAKKHQVS